MISRKYYPQVMTVLMTVFMTIGMTLVMTLILSGQIVMQTFFYDVVIATAAALIANFIFPAGACGNRLAENRGAEEGTLTYLLWMSLVPAVFNGVVMTAVMTALKAGVNANFLPAFLSTLWIGLIVGYIISLLISPFVTRLAHAITEG